MNSVSKYAHGTLMDGLCRTVSLEKLTHPDICCLFETHLSNEITIDINGYLFIKHNRSCKHV